MDAPAPEKATGAGGTDGLLISLPGCPGMIARHDLMWVRP
jgi:hypothetical protein